MQSTISYPTKVRLWGVGTLATAGVLVASALSAAPAAPAHTVSLSAAPVAAAAPITDRGSDTSRGNLDRVAAAAALPAAAPVPAPAPAPALPADPKALTMALMPQFGMSPSDFSCINAIWTQESGWNLYAENRSSGAYGIPQALPGSKMAAFGADWRTNAATQIKWGLSYIKGRYGSACGAAAFKRAHGYY